MSILLTCIVLAFTMWMSLIRTSYLGYRFNLFWDIVMIVSAAVTILGSVTAILYFIWS